MIYHKGGHRHNSLQRTQRSTKEWQPTCQARRQCSQLELPIVLERSKYYRVLLHLRHRTRELRKTILITDDTIKCSWYLHYLWLWYTKKCFKRSILINQYNQSHWRGFLQGSYLLRNCRRLYYCNKLTAGGEDEHHRTFTATQRLTRGLLYCKLWYSCAPAY
jgi:hypothetical protein